MLPNSTVQMINDQIAKEIEHMNSIFCDTQEEKMEALERINKLKSMLTTSPTADEIASALAAALSANEPQKVEHVTTINLNEMIAAITNRFKKHSPDH